MNDLKMNAVYERGIFNPQMDTNKMTQMHTNIPAMCGNHSCLFVKTICAYLWIKKRISLDKITYQKYYSTKKNINSQSTK